MKTPRTRLVTLMAAAAGVSAALGASMSTPEQAFARTPATVAADTAKKQPAAPAKSAAPAKAAAAPAAAKPAVAPKAVVNTAASSVNVNGDCNEADCNNADGSAF